MHTFSALLKLTRKAVNILYLDTRFVCAWIKSKSLLQSTEVQSFSYSNNPDSARGQSPLSIANDEISFLTFIGVPGKNFFSVCMALFNNLLTFFVRMLSWSCEVLCYTVESWACYRSRTACLDFHFEPKVWVNVLTRMPLNHIYSCILARAECELSLYVGLTSSIGFGIC